jgi:hypothetical protein
MVALTAERDTVQRSGAVFSRGVAANAVIYAGALVALNASGFLVPGTAATTLKADGKAAETVRGTAVNGEVTCQVERGVFRFANSAAGDAITRADIGNDCFIVDDDQVARTNGSGTRSIAGRIEDVDAQGVWVRFIGGQVGG